MKKSKIFKIDLKDLLKGFIVAVITAIVTTVYQAIDAGTFELTWLFFQPVLLSALGSGLAYIIKNWLTNSQDQPFKSEPVIYGCTDKNATNYNRFANVNDGSCIYTAKPGDQG